MPYDIAVPRRVLMTTDTMGSVWSFSQALSKALCEAGTETLLVAMGGPLSESHRSEIRGVEGLSVLESRYRLEWMEDPWEDIAESGAWLLDLEKRFSPDLVHLNGYAHAALPFRAPVLVTAHSCVLSWWRAVCGREAPPSWDRYRAAVGQGLASARMVTAPTRKMLSAIQEIYGPVRRGRVIPNGRDPGAYVPARKERIILAAGSIRDEAKNIAALQAVAGRLPWKIYVAGEKTGPDGKGHDLAGVTPLGVLSREELASWYGKASIYALPARYEPFGLTVLEAALSGCALVLGDIGSLREVWGKAARYVKPDDREALAAALAELSSDETLLARRARDARARALMYGTFQMAEGYRSAYAELLSESAVSSEAYGEVSRAS